MAKKATPYQKFEVEKRNKYNVLQSDYELKIDKARDGKQGAAHYKFYYSLIETYRKKQISLGNLSRFLIEIQNELDEDKDKEFAKEFNNEFSKLKVKNESELLKQIAELEAQYEFINYLKREESKYTAEKNNDTLKQTPLADLNSVGTNIKWTGKIELEFVQLIYSLYEANYLTNDEKQITTLVKQVAKAFNVELGKNWQTNLSDNINNRNTDYQPKIFDTLKKSFNDYRDERLIENDKKKKPQ
jgi:hypothetical protein